MNALHGAIARAINIHHFGTLALPSKDGKLDWSIGEPVKQIREMTGADYALFSWVRDSYTSDERNPDRRRRADRLRVSGRPEHRPRALV